MFKKIIVASLLSVLSASSMAFDNEEIDMSALRLKMEQDASYADLVERVSPQLAKKALESKYSNQSEEQKSNQTISIKSDKDMVDAMGLGFGQKASESDFSNIKAAARYIMDENY